MPLPKKPYVIHIDPSPVAKGYYTTITAGNNEPVAVFSQVHNTKAGARRAVARLAEVLGAGHFVVRVKD